MKIMVPSFYRRFHCIGSKCRDNCCIGWEIDVDTDTAEIYKQTTGPLGRRLRQEIIWKEPIHFKLKAEDRCPFLNNKNLCDIFIELGEENLCEICMEHPRFRNNFANREEIGLGLCCEEAVRLLFASPKPLTFVTEDIGSEEIEEEPMLQLIITTRDELFSLIQDRKQPLAERMCLSLAKAYELQEKLDHGIINLQESEDKLDTFDYITYDNPLTSWLKLLKGLEFMGDAWPSMLKKTDEAWRKREVNSFAEVFAKVSEQDYEYEHLLIYFLYRYLIKAVWDNKFLNRVSFAVMSCITIYLFHEVQQKETGILTLSDRMAAVKAYSKEIEYSEENLEKLMDELQNNKNLSSGRIQKLLKI